MENGCVPQCLAQHVKEIEIKGVEDVEDNVKLVEYFMKHCLVLQMMIIRSKRTVSKKQVNHLLRTLSQLHWGFAICDIFIVWTLLFISVVVVNHRNMKLMLVAGMLNKPPNYVLGRRFFSLFGWTIYGYSVVLCAEHWLVQLNYCTYGYIGVLLATL